MFEPKAARNLISFLKVFKVILIVLSLAVGVVGGALWGYLISEGTQYQFSTAGVIVWIFSVAVGIFWAVVSWVVVGVVQHYLAAVTDTAEGVRVLVAHSNLLLSQRQSAN